MTDKQRLFVEAYLGEANFNATRAADIAGYQDPMRQGWELKNKPDIRAAIDERLNQAALTADETLALLTDHATASMADFVDVITERTFMLNFEKAEKRHKLHLIKEISYSSTGAPQIKLVDSQAALVQLGRHHKLFTDKNETDSTVSLSIYDEMSDEELKQRIAELESGIPQEAAPQTP